MPLQAGMRNVLKADVSAGTWVVICKSNDIIFYRPVCQHHSYTGGGRWTHKWRLCPKFDCHLQRVFCEGVLSNISYFSFLNHHFMIRIIFFSWFLPPRSLLWRCSVKYFILFLSQSSLKIHIMFLSRFSTPESLLWRCSVKYFSFSLVAIYMKKKNARKSTWRCAR